MWKRACLRKKKNGCIGTAITGTTPTVFKLTKVSRGDTKTANWAWRILAVLRFKGPNRGVTDLEKATDSSPEFGFVGGK